MMTMAMLCNTDGDEDDGGDDDGAGQDVTG